MSSKYLNLDPNILLEWRYNDSNITENYQVLTDLTTNNRSFMSTTNTNDINHSLFPIDTVQKKYSKINFEKFNFLRLQTYFTPPIGYDKIMIYFPSNYNFGVYYGFYIKISTYDLVNKKKYDISNFYYDKSQTQNISGNIEYADQLMNLGTPFIYNQKEWGKYITFYIPSVYDVSNDRIINPLNNKVTPNSINDNLTNGMGLSLTSPIYIQFSFITSKQVIFDIPYYYLGDTLSTSIPTQPEYENLGVVIEESTQGDFFEIYGIYNGSNENMDDFVDNLESKGRRINIEYTVTLYEENLISGYPITFLVTENFAQKLEYRPVIKYSNTTAAIDVEMKITDLVDNSSLSKFGSVGLTTNLLKYGKTLSKIEMTNLSKPKIYNYKYDKIYNLTSTSNVTDVSIVKVPFPILINLYKILASNYNPSISSDYKSMGLLNIVLTPFDNIIKFQIAKQDSPDGPIVPYNLSEVLLNSKLNLIFRSDSKNIEKEIYYQTDENKFDKGIVVFKINQDDIPTLKQMSKEKSDNFYIILTSNKTKTLLYSGKFKIFENLKFLETTTVTTGTTTTSTLADIALQTTPTTSTQNQSNNVRNAQNYKESNTGGGMNDIAPPQFDPSGLPLSGETNKYNINNFKNIILWIKAGLSNEQINDVINNLKLIGVNINYAYQTPTNTGPTVVILERIEVNKIQRIKNITNIDNVIELALDFGWKKSTDKIYDFSQFGTLQTDPPVGGGTGWPESSSLQRAISQNSAE